MQVKTALLMTGVTAVLVAATACGSRTVQDSAVTEQNMATATGGAVGGNGRSVAQPGKSGELDSSAPDVPEKLASHLWANIIWDGTRADLPGDLARSPEVKLIVVGTIQSIEYGPILFAETVEDSQAEQQVVIGVKVKAILKGVRPASGMVYVQLSGPYPLEEYRAGLPLGTVTGLYLSDPPQAAKHGR